MGRIIAIGGGEIADAETEAIDRHACECADADVPAALFVPTASGDAAGYRAAFDAYYGDRLGCRTRHLTLFDEDVGEERIRTDLEWADLVYVGGGSVPRLLERWRALGVDRALGDVHRDGTVLIGLSAGAVCWFDGALVESSDEPDETGPDPTEPDGDPTAENEDPAYEWLECLGWVDDLACTPHADPARGGAFREHLDARGRSGVALEDGCAIEIVDGEYRILAATGDEGAVGYTYRDGRLRVTELDEDGFRNLETLR